MKKQRKQKPYLIKQRGEEEEKEYIVTAGTYKKGELEEGWPKMFLYLNYM